MFAKNDKEFHKIVCEREGYTCQACGKNYNIACYFDENGVNQYVCGHHMKSKSSHPELRFDVDNGMCVDDDCHKKIHSGEIKVGEMGEVILNP